MTDTIKESDFTTGYNIGCDALDELYEKGTYSTDAIAGILSATRDCLYEMAQGAEFKETAEEIISFSQKQVHRWSAETRCLYKMAQQMEDK